MLNNKIDFAVVFTVKNANPNGDPLGGNRPRTTSEGLGEVSDVCLKRKIRNRLQQMGEKIFVQTESLRDDGFTTLSERYKSFTKGLKKEDIPQAVCKEWIDVRAFGQVFAFDSKDDKETSGVSLGIRGPVTIQSAFTRQPVMVESIQITKSVSGNVGKDGNKASDTMGMKHRVNNAVYITYGSMSPQLAEKTGFSDEDANKIKAAICTLFEGDESSARPGGSMEIKNVVWWKHNNKSGQYSSAKVHSSLDIDESGNLSVQNLEGLKPEIIEG